MTRPPLPTTNCQLPTVLLSPYQRRASALQAPSCQARVPFSEACKVLVGTLLGRPFVPFRRCKDTTARLRSTNRNEKKILPLQRCSVAVHFRHYITNLKTIIYYYTYILYRYKYQSPQCEVLISNCNTATLQRYIWQYTANTLTISQRSRCWRCRPTRY